MTSHSATQVRPPKNALSRWTLKAIDPTGSDAYAHLWWLDRMVRSNRSLVERMTT